MHKFKLILAVILVVGCTPIISIDERGITPLWKTNKKTPVVVEPKKVTTHEFRFLLIEDPDRRGEISKTQLAMITGKSLRDFMKENCVKDSSGAPQMRFISVKQVEKLTGVWAEMAEKVKDIPPPKFVAMNGDAVSAKALPDKWPDLEKEIYPIAGVSP